MEFIRGRRLDDPRVSGAFNHLTRKTPRMRAECLSVRGVGNAVKWARENGRSFATHSTGHCFAGHSMHEGLVIGTSRLRHIRHDPAAGRVTVGAGAFIGDVYMKLAEARQALGGGSYRSVGVAGLTLGGGVGFRSRKSGLLCDQLERLTMVDANGRIVQASATENPDLFWACRGGGGGSFGIVTELVFRTAHVPVRQVIYVYTAARRSDAERIAHDWQHWSRDRGQGTTTHLQISRRRQREYVVALTGEAEARSDDVLAAARDLMGSRVNVHENGVSDYYSERGLTLVRNADDVITPTPVLSKSDYIAKAVPREGFTAVFDALERAKPGQVQLTIEALGGAVDDIAPDATAYPHRGAAYLVEFRANPPDIFRLAEYRKAIDDVKTAYAPYATGGVYVNYPYPTLENWADAYWGPNLPRLKAIKRKWDPDNIFHHAQSVPL